MLNMQWLKLVFSNQSRDRNLRHVACWVLWWLYLVFSIFFTKEIPARGASGGLYHHQPGLHELGYMHYSLLVSIKSVLLLFSHLFFCYCIIYFLLPKFLSKNNYGKLGAAILILCFLMVSLGYFLFSIVYPFVDSMFSLSQGDPKKWMFYASVDAGLINAIKLTLVAAAIQLLKQWWLKQKEKEKLEREKINAELQLLKAQIHPAFLFNTLSNITVHARSASGKAPEMLIQLSDLLSYMLYECDAPKVKLEKEISMLKEYMALEKLRQGERLEMIFQVKEEPNGQLISPLLLLPFIENSFFYTNKESMDQAWVNLDITVEGQSLSMKLINGMPAGTAWDKTKEEQSFANVKKRLILLYPDRHDLKINGEQELLMVHLNLTLEEPTSEDKAIRKTTKPAFNYA
jgi:sensor histidine kinase YesM